MCVGVPSLRQTRHTESERKQNRIENPLANTNFGGGGTARHTPSPTTRPTEFPLALTMSAHCFSGASAFTPLSMGASKTRGCRLDRKPIIVYPACFCSPDHLLFIEIIYGFFLRSFRLPFFFFFFTCFHNRTAAFFLGMIPAWL